MDPHNTHSDSIKPTTVSAQPTRPWRRTTLLHRLREMLLGMALVPQPLIAVAGVHRIQNAPEPHALPTTAASPTRFLAHEGSVLAYDDTGGPGPLVIAIPGMGDLRTQYRALRPHLQAAGYRVVTLDVRGHGETSAHWSDYSARAVARDALAVIQHVQAGPAVVLGNSFAAGSALWAAQLAPHSVRGVVLLGPIVRDGDPPWWTRKIVDIGLGGPWRVWFWMTYWNSLFPAKRPSDHAQAAAALEKNLKAPGRMEALSAMVRLSKQETEAIVPRNRTPALILMGSRDPDFPDPIAEAQWLAQMLGVQAHIIDGAGHYPHLEMPQRVAPLVLEFLSGLTQKIDSTP